MKLASDIVYVTPTHKIDHVIQHYVLLGKPGLRVYLKLDEAWNTITLEIPGLHLCTIYIFHYVETYYFYDLLSKHIWTSYTNIMVSLYR